MNVLILGAGVSAPAGFPLGRNLAADLRSWLVPGHASGELEIWEALERDGTFKRNGDLELDLTRLDVRIIEYMRQHPAERGVPFEAQGERPFNLVTFRTLTLPENLSSLLLTRQHEAFEEGRVDYLRKFLRGHVHAGDTVITFNYDALVEALLHELGLWNLRDGYGVDLKDAYPALAIEAESQSRVLKLHGSAGWMSASSRRRLLLSQAVLKAIGYPDLVRKGFEVPVDVSHMSVPPSYIKGFTRYPLPRLWRAAGAAIRIAENVAIIGYSMPGADATAQMLCTANLRRGQRVTYYWHAESENVRARNLARLFAQSGAIARDRQSSIQELGDAPTLWP